MNPTPISVINQHFTDGTPIDCFEGTMKSVYARKSGGDGEKQWSFQDAEITDAAGDIIRIKFKGCDEMGHWKGKRVRITCSVTNKGKNGLYVLDDEYNGKTTRKLRITPSATIVDLNDSQPVGNLSGAVNQAIENRAAANTQAAPPAAPPAQSSGPASDKARFVEGVKMRAVRIAAMHQICVDAAVYEAFGILARHGYALTPEKIMIMADRFFGELIRRSDVDLMPVDPYKAGYNGRSLQELIPELEKQVAQTRSRNSMAAAPPPAAPPPAAPPWEPEPAEDQVPF